MKLFEPLAPLATTRARRGTLAAGLWLAAGSPAWAFTLETPAMTVAAEGWLRADTAASVPGGWRSLAVQPQPGSAPMSLDLSGQSALRLDVAWTGAMTAAGPWDNSALSLTVCASHASTGVGVNRPDVDAACRFLAGPGLMISARRRGTP